MEPAVKFDPMTETALRSLHDIAVPPPVSWMPQTWGWATVAAIASALLLLLALRAARRFHRNAYRREALRRLEEIEVEMASPDNRDHAIRALAELLKRTALAAWPRMEVAAMTGADWARFLDGTGERGEALDRLLDDFEYRRDATLSSLPSSIADDAVLSARRWIERHHVPT